MEPGGMRPLKLGGDFGSVRAGWRGLRGRRCAISRRGRLDGGRPWATKGEGPGQGSVLRRGALPALSLLLTAGLVDAAFSGDWSRIGAITPEAEETLKGLCQVAVPAELAYLVWVANRELRGREGR